MNVVFLFLAVLIILSLLDGANCFCPAPTLPTIPRRQHSCSSPPTCLFSSKQDDNLDDMRRLLEASWNIETMGAVPTNPEDAADAAATSIQSAVDNGESLFFVDLLLPSYDISQGKNMYDEVLAVEFCIALANSLEEQSCILVRDGKTRNSVSRILKARERNQAESDDEATNKEVITDEDDQDDEEESEFFDDFADFGGIVGGDSDTPTAKDAAIENVDAFREQLMAKWDDPPAEKSDLPVKNSAEEAAAGMESSSPPKPEKQESPDDKLYRLATLFGDATISSGPDMFDQVVKAVSDNGLPTDNEETIIILSAVQKDEMIAVRSLVAKYKGKKNIILVNCQLDPLPRELIRAKTVYSILPLIARPVVSDENLFGGNKQPPQEGESPPKVVVMRRYPKDWEVYVDADGNGFELADVAKESQIRGKKGPPMEWIAGCVKRHMESKLGGGGR